jgi:hypothetical protein
VSLILAVPRRGRKSLIFWIIAAYLWNDMMGSLVKARACLDFRVCETNQVANFRLYSQTPLSFLMRPPNEFLPGLRKLLPSIFKTSTSSFEGWQEIQVKWSICGLVLRPAGLDNNMHVSCLGNKAEFCSEIGT